MRLTKTFSASVFFIVLSVSVAFGQVSVTDQPAFSASAPALQQAFEGIQPGSNSLTILLDEMRFDLDAQGHAVSRYRMIFKAWTKEGAESSAFVEQLWSPWEEERPVVRARVITPDGTVRELDPSTVADAPASDDPDIVTDRRRVRAPLPAMDAGSIVEQEILTRQTRSLLEGTGDIRHFFFGASVPVELSRMVIRAPAALTLRYKPLLLPLLRVQDETRNGMREIRLEQGHMDALEEIPPLMPSDVPRSPYVVFSTGKAWRDVAVAYANVVDRQLQGFDARTFLPSFPQNAAREQKLLAIVEKLNREIRYTGLEFGESSVVPHTPAEVLDHKYGDCKDQAALAVAMIRAAGMEAHVALLRSSSGADVLSDLPGMGAFNHAIVYVPGSPDYWLDLTDPDLRLGVLSPPNQDRLSLIARAGTTELVRTPTLGASENRIIETREFELPELGRARIVETSETFGVPDRSYRGAFSGQDQEQLQETLKDYVDTVYGEAKIANVRAGDGSDLAKPFSLRLELTDAQRGTAARTEAVVGIFASHLTERLPVFFRQAPDKEDKDAVEKERARSQDFALTEPYTYEYHYKIKAPAGFRLRQLPEDSDEKVGPATLSVRFTKQSDVEVAGVLRFQIAQRRLNAAEGFALRDAVVELQNRKPLVVYFDQIGETALAEGKVAEALQAFSALRAAHPDEALHALQYARGLLAAGAGASARAEARRAVELEPQSANAYLQLAEILKHDLVGREMEKGLDRDGAIEAYRKALELQPDDSVSRANLAILMEHDRNGVRYGSGARMDEAIAEYKTILDELADLGVSPNYPIVLLRVGRMQELRDYLRTQPDSETNLTLAVCAEAALNGIPAAIGRASAISGVAARQRVLVSAAQTLVTVRRFDLAPGLMEAAATGSQNPAALAGALQILRAVKPVEQMSPTPEVPEDAVRLLLARIVLFDQHENDWHETLSPTFRESSGARPEAVRRSLGSVRSLSVSTGLTPEAATDFVLAALQFTREGDDETGYVIRLAGPGSDSRLTFLVSGTRGAYQIVGVSGALEPVGQLALELARQGQLNQAALWLDRVRREMSAGSADDPLSGTHFTRLWQLNQTDRSADAIRLAAAALRSGESGAALDEVVKILEAARQKPGASPVVSGALARAYRSASRHADEHRVALALLEDLPNSPAAFLLAIRAAYATGGKDSGRAVIDAHLGKYEQDVQTLRRVADLALNNDDPERSAVITRRIIDSGRAEARDYNQLAWGDILQDRVTATTLEIANRGVLLTSSAPNPSLLHTLAAVNAELGRTSDARNTLLQRLKLEQSDEPSDDDWYVFGRIAELYGLKEEAAAMYRRLQPPDRDMGLSATSYALAQRRLEALEGK